MEDLKQTFPDSLGAEQLRSRVQRCVVATVEDSVLHTEMTSLESQEEDGLCQTFFASCVGANVPDLTELPLSAYGCRKFHIDTLGNHLCTCTAHSGVKKAHDWSVDDFTDRSGGSGAFGAEPTHCT